jgi:predicted secreted protein
MANNINGSEIYLIINDDWFANEKGLSSSGSTDVLETTDKHSTGKVKTYLSGEHGGTISVNGLYCVSDPSGQIGFHDIDALRLAGTAVTFELGYFASGGIIQSGSALITACNLSADQNSPGAFDVTLQKSGAYTESDYSS